jgi:hypothetical protein
VTPVDERIREAWRTGVPMELHRAAEELAAQGYEESAIYDALERLLLEVREAGADDEAEERISNVMDRLTGWCHESNHIKTRRTDPPPDGKAGPAVEGVPPEAPPWSLPR